MAFSEYGRIAAHEQMTTGQHFFPFVVSGPLDTLVADVDERGRPLLISHASAVFFGDGTEAFQGQSTLHYDEVTGDALMCRVDSTDYYVRFFDLAEPETLVVEVTGGEDGFGEVVIPAGLYINPMDEEGGPDVSGGNIAYAIY